MKLPFFSSGASQLAALVGLTSLLAQVTTVAVWMSFVPFPPPMPLGHLIGTGAKLGVRRQ
jgi:hypothetical protein